MNVETFAVLLDRACQRVASDGVDAATVKKILDHYCAPSSGEAFWQGSGDDLWGALAEAGWETWRFAAQYYWVMTRTVDAGLGGRVEFVAYTEGDVSFSDNPSCEPTRPTREEIS